MKIILAIDPGAAGGMAVRVFGRTVGHGMPETEGDRLELIRDIKRAAEAEHAECVCVLEEVRGFAGKAQPGSAMFKFGEGYGFIKGVVQTLGIKLMLVRPQVWQKMFGLGTAARCADKTEWKNKLKAEAQRRFPELNVTLKTADALLILEWALHAGLAANPQSQINFGRGESPLPGTTKIIFRRDAEKDSRAAVPNNNNETTKPKIKPAVARAEPRHGSRYNNRKTKQNE